MTVNHFLIARRTALSFILTVLAIGFSGCDMPTISKTIDMDRFDVPAGNMAIKVLKIEDITDKPIEIKVEAQHLVGPPVDFYILDKANYNLWDSAGKWITTARDSDPVIRRVLSDEFKALDSSLEITKFQDKLATSWIDAGSHNVLYLVACSRDKMRVAEISAVVHVREKQ